METFTLWKGRAQHLHAYVYMKVSSLTKFVWGPTKRAYWFIVFHSNPLFAQLCYFLSVSFAGFLALRILEPKNEANRPKNVDLFFMSVSALTVSSMQTVEMEVFSNLQLWVFILMMLVGGEVFTSMLGLQFMKASLKKKGSIKKRFDVVHTDLESSNPTNSNDQVECGSKYEKDPDCPKSVFTWSETHSIAREYPEHEIIRYLGFVVLAYLIIVIMGGSMFIFLYLRSVPSAADVLIRKGIQVSTFSIFTSVSSFGNCGFTPTNENMVVFRKNSALLLLIIPQILAGNTLYPPCLRFMTWALKKITRKEQFDYALRDASSIGYKHLFPQNNSMYLVFTAFGFALVQLVIFCSLEWNSEGLGGLNAYQKFVGALFQSVNSRHAGESIVDISSLSSAVLVLYIVMMYLSPYTRFIPNIDVEWTSADKKMSCGMSKLLKGLILSQLSYLTIFIILICMVERKAILADPLNFNVLSIVFEVISAYGNVGFSVGYSCQKLLKPDSHCKDEWLGFVGRWSNRGKLILIFVMIFGRLKKFNMEGGKSWKLE